MAYVPMQSYMLGAGGSGSGTMVNIEVAGPPLYAPPHYTFLLYSKQIQLGDGTVRGAGWTTLTWHWDVITPTQRDWLRTFCPLQSSSVWIQTLQLDNNEAYKIYQAVMVWPVANEELDAHRRMKFDILFQRLIPG